MSIIPIFIIASCSQTDQTIGEAGTKVFSSNEREDIVIIEKNNKLLPICFP
ncbi:hypothetical protein [Oceanobacillus sojae]|uniref:hypothetical protein n=1 Tax=Oceanobacillus sojae TaxID=582851 RepID=UPI0021A497CE|nr:hypothetical protein [Oceanobacillus sojae]MCT1902722.1 hypothetical protein [Oceanobacillus sojae]